MVRLTWGATLLTIWTAGIGTLWAQAPNTLRTPLPIPRILTYTLQGRPIPQTKCVQVATNSLQTLGFSDLRPVGTDPDRSIYGYGEGTTGLIRCNSNLQLVLFVVSTVHSEVDTRAVGEMLVKEFTRGAGVPSP